MATPVPPDKPQQGAFWNPEQGGDSNEDTDSVVPIVPQPLKEAADAYIKAMHDVHEYIGANRKQEGRNWNPLVASVLEAAQTLKNVWADHEDVNLHTEMGLPEIPKSIELNFDGYGPQEKDSPEPPPGPPESHYEVDIDPADRHAWIAANGIKPIIHPEKISWLKRLGKHPNQEANNDTLWVLGEDEEAPEGWIPLLSPEIKDSLLAFPQKRNGEPNPNYLLPNPEAGELGTRLHNLVSLNLESPTWQGYLKFLIDNHPEEFRDVNHIISSWIGYGINLPTNDDGSPQFMKASSQEDAADTYRMAFLHDDFFYNLMHRVIDKDHPDYETMYIGNVGPSGEKKQRSTQPDEVMIAVQNAIEQSGIDTKPAPWHSLRPGTSVRTGAGAFDVSNLKSLTGVAKTAQQFQSYRYHMLHDIATRLRRELETQDVEIPPRIVWDGDGYNIDKDPTIRDAYDLLEEALGPKALNKLGDPSGRKERVSVIGNDGKQTWEETGKPYTYATMLENLEGFVKELRTIYEAGESVAADSGYRVQPWEQAVGGFSVGSGRQASGYTVSEGIFKTLKGMGLIDADDQYSPYYHVPEEKLSHAGGFIPSMGGALGDEGIFTMYGADAKPNHASLKYPQLKTNFRDIFAQLAKDDPDNFGPDSVAGKYMSSFQGDNVPDDPTDAKEHNNNVFFGFQHEEIRDDGTGKKEDEPPISNPTPPIPPTGGAAAGGGADGPEDTTERMIRELVEAEYGPTMGPTVGGKDDANPDKQAYIDEMRHLANVDYNEFKREWTENYSRPLREKRRAGKTIGTTQYGHADIDGVEKEKTLLNIRSNFKEMNGHDINEAELTNLSRVELEAYDKKLTTQVGDHRHTMFIREANDVSHITPLSPEESQSKHAILQQYRRIYNYGEKYGTVLDDKDQGTPGTPGYKPSAKSQLRDLLGQIEQSAQAVGLTTDDFTNDKKSFDEVAKDLGYTYGSDQHINEDNARNSQRVQAYQKVVDYYQNANEGGAKEDHLQQDSMGSGDFAYTGEDGQVIRYNLDQPGSRMTYHNGPNRGQLISNAGDYEGVSMSQQTEPDLKTQSSPHKIFGMNPEIEAAYKGAYQGTNDLKEMATFYGTVMGSLAEEGLIPQFIEDEQGNPIPNPLYTTGPLMMDSKSGVSLEDVINYVTPLLSSDNFSKANVISAMILHLKNEGHDFSTEEVIEKWEEDRQLVNDLPSEIEEHRAILQNALETGAISQKTFDTLDQHINFSTQDAREAMIGEGHNNFGMPVDENGVAEETPMYMGNDGEMHPRVYHRATKMWYNPEMLDDLRNQQGLGTYVNSPYSLVSPAGVRLGQDGNGKPNYEHEDDPDIYRLGVPSANNTRHTDPNEYHGIFISRTGVHRIGSLDNTNPPTMDENGDIVNHGGENGDQPYSSDEVSQQAFGHMWRNSNQKNPAQFTDAEGNPTNVIPVTPDGHFDGGWKEWLQNPQLAFTEMPGIRKVKGMRRLNKKFYGEVADRPNPAHSQDGWRGPQTWSGNQVTKPNEPKPKMSALQALRQFGTLNVPQRMNPTRTPQGRTKDIFGRRPGEKRTALRAMWDSINMSIPSVIGDRPLGPISLDAAINEWEDGETSVQQGREKFANDLRHFTSRTGQTINPQTGRPYIEGDAAQQTDDYLDAKQTVEQAEGDPRQRPVVQNAATTSENESNIPV